MYKSQLITLILGKNAGAVSHRVHKQEYSKCEYALVPAKLLYSPPAQSVLGTSLYTTGDESCYGPGLAEKTVETIKVPEHYVDHCNEIIP